MMEGPRNQHLHQEWQEPLEEPSPSTRQLRWLSPGHSSLVVGKNLGVRVRVFVFDLGLGLKRCIAVCCVSVSALRRGLRPKGLRR